ncbi:DUF5677 domain-containing protein [Streptomyces massasporeus]|uniref:DUF5677 domain-containing protein n=1 Tax=Streptomyces massasporeus TaxID=67324 RepID=UPI00370108BD
MAVDKYREVNFNVLPSERFGIYSRKEVSTVIRMALADFPELLSATLEELHVITRVFFTETANKAAAIVGNHAFNDFDGLVDALLSGDGRGAARISRSLYEHLVNYCEVMSSTIAAERYMAHSAVTAELLGNLTHGLPHLKGVEQKRERSRLAKLKRDCMSDLKSAILKFGTAFRRDWSSSNLYDRASKHGYGDKYDIYRLLSHVTHGSCGGVMGNYSAIAGLNVHRTGPSLGLAALSYLEGLTFFRDFIKEIGARQGVETRQLLASLNSLIAYWPTYRLALRVIDRRLWPSSPPPSPTPIMALYPNGRIRWFYWEPTLNMMKAANPPPGSDWIEKSFREHVRGGHVDIPSNMDGRPVSSAVENTQVFPKEGAEWFTATAIFPPGPKPEISWFNPRPDV